MIRLVISLPALCLCTGAFAGTIIYTDSTHSLSPSSAGIPVVYLDAPDHLQAELFGSLPADAALAKKQARDILTSPDFKARQLQLAGAYQGVMKAWSIGLKKYPAVVFDDKWVVYGTTDVDVATQQLNAWREGNQ
jgi:integrating conjugative element protein (TIGR03757 family)